MEFCTRAKKCVSRNNYGLLGRVTHEMHLALKRETGAFGRGAGNGPDRDLNVSKKSDEQTPLKGSRTSLQDRWTFHAFIFGPFKRPLIKSTPCQ